MRVVRGRSDSSVDKNSDAHVLKTLTEFPNPLGDAIRLSEVLTSAMQMVTANIFNKLPLRSLSWDESQCFLRGMRVRDRCVVEKATRASVSDILFLPVTFAGANPLLNTSSLSKRVKYALGIYSEALSNLQHIRAAQRIQPINVPPATLSAVANAAVHLLLRAYAEGLRIVLSRYVHALFDSQRDRPRLTVPWLLISHERGAPESVRIVWAHDNAKA